MGTSNSSTGPGSGLPLVPPWAIDPPSVDGDSNDGRESQAQQSQPAPQSPLAPARRFSSARRSLGDFARTGASDRRFRGLGHYVHKGYGGAGIAAQRMAGAARTAGILYSVLSSTDAGQPVASSPLDLTLLKGQSAYEIIDAVVEAVRPIDGTQDAEAGQRAINEALSELLNRFPDTSLLDLSEDQRIFAIETYIALEVFNRFDLDLGKTLQDKAPNPREALSRLNDVKDYIRETVSDQFRDLRIAGEQIDGDRISKLAQQALHDTFVVFEEYVQ